MPREIIDTEGISWTCIQAYAGLSSDAVNDKDKDSAAQVEGAEDHYYVVCTPSGGAQSVRLKLKGDWEQSYSDEALLQEITQAQEQTEDS